MKIYRFEKINKSNIPEMTELLKERQRVEGKEFQFITNEKLDDAHLTRNLEKIFEKAAVVAIGAYVDNEMAGYMLAQVKYDELRGRHAWIPYEGVAVKGGVSVELIRQLYAEVSSLWLSYGCFTHYAVLPAGQDGYVNAFQKLSFGFEQAHGILDIDKYQEFDNVRNGNVRTGTKEDRDIVAAMSDIIASFQSNAPVYAIALPEYIQDIRRGYKGIVDDEEALLLIAEMNGTAAGFQAYWPCTLDLMIPERAIELSVAGTLPSFMGRGIGKNLMNEAVRILKERDYRYIITDWRITNLASSSFWPSCGFMPIYHRMQRTLDGRISWANFHNPLLKDK